jgi:hypothetical protein
MIEVMEESSRTLLNNTLAYSKRLNDRNSITSGENLGGNFMSTRYLNIINFT